VAHLWLLAWNPEQLVWLLAHNPEVVSNLNSQETAHEAAHLPSLRHIEHKSNLLDGEDAHEKIFTTRPWVIHSLLAGRVPAIPLSARAGYRVAWMG
jgi:hypothetical protein